MGREKGPPALNNLKEGGEGGGGEAEGLPCMNNLNARRCVPGMCVKGSELIMSAWHHKDGQQIAMSDVTSVCSAEHD